MKIVYHCIGNHNASLLAAAVHLGKLPRDKVPTYSELINCAYFDDTFLSDWGKIIYVGNDSYANEVYVLAHKNIGNVVLNVLQGFEKIFNIEEGMIQYRNAQSIINAQIKIGWMLRKLIGMRKIGEKIVVRGIKNVYPEILKLTLI